MKMQSFILYAIHYDCKPLTLSIFKCIFKMYILVYLKWYCTLVCQKLQTLALHTLKFSYDLPSINTNTQCTLSSAHAMHCDTNHMFGLCDFETEMSNIVI